MISVAIILLSAEVPTFSFSYSDGFPSFILPVGMLSASRISYLEFRSELDPDTGFIHRVIESPLQPRFCLKTITVRPRRI